MGCIKVGVCEYCGEARNVEAEEYDTERRVDQLATEQCVSFGKLNAASFIRLFMPVSKTLIIG